MFRHLKAADFINLVEGVELPATERGHLDACAKCRATSESVRSIHADVSSLETEIPEPDWTHFRSSVRDELLSRSIQRQSVVRRWTGWAIRPAVAWALSLVMVAGMTTITVIWKTDQRVPEPVTPVAAALPPGEAAVEMIGAGPERSLFDDVVLLGEEEQEQLRLMLESAEKGLAYPQ